MLPLSEDLMENFEEERMPSLTFRLDSSNCMMQGTIDGFESMKQAIFLILNSERYEYLIYSWNYGVELGELFGEPVSYVLPELKRRITEALEQDDRITGVKDFQFDTSKKGSVFVTFTVETNSGEIGVEKEVLI